MASKPIDSLAGHISRKEASNWLECTSAACSTRCRVIWKPPTRQLCAAIAWANTTTPEKGSFAFFRSIQTHVEARAHLVALTANVGAFDEARHHLAKLEALLPPEDAVLAAARGLLDNVSPSSSSPAQSTPP